MQANGTAMGTGGTEGRPPLTRNNVADAARAWHVDDVGGFVDKALPNGRQAGRLAAALPGQWEGRSQLPFVSMKLLHRHN